MAQGNETATGRKLTFKEQLKSFSRYFWVANMMEMFERLAFYGVRAVVGLYIVDAAARGGLELEHTTRGFIFFIWALIQTLLPMFTGGFSDRYGYKKSLYLAFTINIAGYIVMGLANGFGSFLGGVIMVATGTAIFKPPLHGTLAHTVDESNSSLGWGFFYQLVNIGGFIGPFVAGQLRVIDWQYVFFASALFTAVNFLPTIFLLKDFSDETRKAKREAGQLEEKGPFATFADSMMTLIKDTKFMVFLLIFSGFWLMFMQLFDTFPIFIQEWVDSRGLLHFFQHTLHLSFINADEFGNVPPEYMVNVDAGTIVLLMPLIGYITGKFKPVVMMVVGMLISTLALVFTGINSVGGIVVFGIFLFAIGEMMCSPKFSEYIGLMAPPEKKALYMGYSNIPFAIGWSLAGLMSGITYGAYSDKYMLGRRYLIEELGLDQTFVHGLQRTEVIPTIVNNVVGINDPFQATKVLWDQYNPWITWIFFGAVGMAMTLAMLIYHFWLEAEKRRLEREANA
ncbi:MAG: MFS transporter [bacterium]